MALHQAPGTTFAARGCNRHLRFVSPEPQTQCGIGSELLKMFPMKYMTRALRESVSRAET